MHAEMRESQTTCRGHWNVRLTSQQSGESMRAKELVPILAEIYGVPFVEAFQIDRSLAEHGLRARGRGKAIPHMTRREAVIFLVACMVTERTTRAADDVRPWLSADGGVLDKQEPSYEEERAALGVEDAEYDDTIPDDEDFRVKNHHLRAVLEAMDFTPSRSGLKPSLSFIDFLVAAAGYLADHSWAAEEFSLEISSSHGRATVRWGDTDDVSKVEFWVDQEEVTADYETEISRSSSIFGGALAALARRTEAP